MDVLTQLYAQMEPNGRPYIRMVLDGITETVGGSFMADKSRVTRSEVDRRTRICAKWFLTYKRDLNWSTQRSLDELPRALRSELDGIAYTPSREGEQSWSTDNGRDLAWLPKT